MTLSLLQAGHGDHRVLVVAFFVANHDALAAFGPDACVLVDNDNAHGRFAGAPGGSGVASWTDTLRTATTLAGPFTPSATVLVGWSAGAQAVREQLRHGTLPDAVIALDGTSGNVPPAWSQLEPWHTYAARARRGEALLVLTATQNVYTRDLPPGERYEATAYVVTELYTHSRPMTSAELLPPVDPGSEYREGDFVVAVHRSGRIDGEAHRREQNVHLPDLVRRVVLPWLLARRAAAPTDPPDTLPTGAQPDRSARALQAALNRAGASPPLAVDGIIGPLTRAALRAFQGAHGLPVTGEADAATWAALAPVAGQKSATTKAMPAMTPDTSIPSPHYYPGWPSPPRLIVLHSTETPCAPGSARAVARAFQSAATQASAHDVIGPDAVFSCVDLANRAWHVGAPGNGFAIGVEQTGFAHFTAEDWASAPVQAMLANVVVRVADICRQTGIPAVCVDVDGIRAGASGITTHAMVAKAVGGSTHWDPGPHYPLDDVIARVRALLDEDDPERAPVAMTP